MAHANLKSQKQAKPVRMVVRKSSKRKTAKAHKQFGLTSTTKKGTQLGVTELIVTSEQKEQRLPTEPTAEEIAESRAVARSLFDPAAAAAARAAFLQRQQP